MLPSGHLTQLVRLSCPPSIGNHVSPSRRLDISLRRGYAMKATRISLGQQKLVYILVADKRLKYQNGKSHVAYIGTTQNGAERIAGSVAARVEEILGLRGVTQFEARIVTCRPRQRVRTWRKLERAMLLTFRELYAEVPLCNSHGPQMRETDEFTYFSRVRIRKILEEIQ